MTTPIDGNTGYVQSEWFCDDCQENHLGNCPKVKITMTTSTSIDSNEIDEIIATYLEGLHNPSEDGLYNELRAKRDTKMLKDAINAMLVRARKDELERCLEHIPKNKWISGELAMYAANINDRLAELEGKNATSS